MAETNFKDKQNEITSSNSHKANEFNEIILALYYIPKAENNFPQDRMGEIIMNFKSHTYKFQKYVLHYSKVLKEIFSKESNLRNFDLGLTYADSMGAFDLIMKLLFGFKEVIIPKLFLVKCYCIIEELSNYQI